MKPQSPDINTTRRSFLSGSGGLAAGVLAGFGSATSKVGHAALPRCSVDGGNDAFHGGFGSLRLTLLERSADPVAVPVRISAPDSRAEIDLTGKTPRIRIGTGADALVLEPAGLRLKVGGRLQRWSTDSVTALLDRFANDRSRIGDLFALRAAVFALYPEYLRRAGKAAPKAMAQSQARRNQRLAGFGRKAPAGEVCSVETIVEETTRTVRTTIDQVITAAERYANCSAACDRRFLRRGREDYLGFAVCEADCLASGFTDLVVGTIELLETIVESVTRRTVVCAAAPVKQHFIDPIRGLFDARPYADLLSGAVGTQEAIPPELVGKASDILVKMVKTLPAAIQCIATGEWSITELQEIGLDLSGVGQVPLGVRVCMDHDCAMRLLGAGLGAEAFSIISGLIALASGGGVATAVAAAGITAAAAVTVTQILLAMLAVLIVLMVHLMIVAGQIVLYEAGGLIEAGICITHPSLPVILAGVANPLLGLLALGNMPLVVTPRA